MTIQQQTTTSFNALSVQEIITMLPVMDRMAREFRDASSRKDRSESAYSDYRKAGLQLLTMHKLGFTTADPAMMQWDVRDFPEAKELGRQFQAEPKYREVKSTESTGLSIVPPTRHEE